LRGAGADHQPRGNGADVIALAGLVFGVVLGAVVARRRGGVRLDMAHHAAVFGILFAVVGMIVTIVITRMA